MATTKEYATQCEVCAASEILNCAITIWLKGQQCIDEQLYADIYYISRFNSEGNFDRHINLLLSNNHYQVMLFDIVEITQQNTSVHIYQPNET